MEFDIISLDQDSFEGIRREWRELLSSSCADALFLSWEWQFSWWNTWGEKLKLKLCLLKIMCAGDVVGIVPLFRDVYCPLPGLKIRRLQFIGNHWRANDTVRSEYLGPIISVQYRQQAVAALSKHLLNRADWDEFLICDQKQIPGASLDLSRQLVKGNCLLKTWEIENSYQISLSGEYSDYLKSLGKNTRLKLFNRRKLASRLSIGYKSIKGKRQGPLFFDKLNEFHRARWGKNCFENESLSFHLGLIEYCEDEGSQLITNLSSLHNDSGDVSVLYDIKAGDRVSNIQSGFSEQCDKRLSLGTLHLGYEIESSYLDGRVAHYDFLAGEGKNINYKSRLSTSKIELKTVSHIRKPLYKQLLWIYQILPRSLTRILLRAANYVFDAR